MVNDLEYSDMGGEPCFIELHVPLARAGSPETPDSMVFDLDPGDRTDILDCARVALILRDLLSRLQLDKLCKNFGHERAPCYISR